MNIFYLNHDQKICAQDHCDKHVVKMILETAQMLSAVHDRHNSWTASMYKPTHTGHPCTRWAGDSILHYEWLHKLGMELCYEYTNRYGKVHKTEAVLEALRKPPAELYDLYPAEWQDLPKCMPEEFKRETSLESYKIYYRQKQHTIDMKWWKNFNNAPQWFFN